MSVDKISPIPFTPQPSQLKETKAPQPQPMQAALDSLQTQLPATANLESKATVQSTSKELIAMCTRQLEFLQSFPEEEQDHRRISSTLINLANYQYAQGDVEAACKSANQASFVLLFRYGVNNAFLHDPGVDAMIGKILEFAVIADELVAKDKQTLNTILNKPEKEQNPRNLALAWHQIALRYEKLGQIAYAVENAEEALKVVVDRIGAKAGDDLQYDEIIAKSLDLASKFNHQQQQPQN